MMSLMVSLLLLLLLLTLLLSSSSSSSEFIVSAIHEDVPDGIVVYDEPINNTFQVGDDVPLQVNSLTSTHTLIPRDYYHLPFCQPNNNGPTVRSSGQNLGQVLTGNKIQSSPYKIQMLTDVYCAKVCQVLLSRTSAAILRLHIKDGYHHNWILDNLPSAFVGMSHSGEERKRYAGGFPIGFMNLDDNVPYVYNHVNIRIQYIETNNDGSSQYRVVRFAVEPLSVQHKFRNGNYVWDGKSLGGFYQPLSTCPNQRKHFSRDDINTSQVVKSGEKILYTYDVIWERSDNIEWSSRWDVYLTEDHLVPSQVHWYSITNSLFVVMFLSMLVIKVLVRSLQQESAEHVALVSSEASAEDNDETEIVTAALDNKNDKHGPVDETGWKALQADVFNPPSTCPMLCCVFVGSGAQLCVTALLVIILSAIGFVSPARRGSFVNAMLGCYMLTSTAAGYISTRLYKGVFRGDRPWQLCAILTAVVFPGIAFGMFVVFNIIFWFIDSVASVPFMDVLMVAGLWGCVSIPLVFLGAHLGYYKKDTREFSPTVTTTTTTTTSSSSTTVARAIPKPRSWWMHPLVGILLSGILSFAASYVELYFIMTSLWMNLYYYVFGFTLMVYLIVIVTCAEVAILLVYYQLNNAENHQWWWYSFFASGSIAFYIFAYSVAWFQTLEASPVLITYLLYFGYMLLINFAVFLVFGSVGTLSTLWFIRKIYSNIPTKATP